MDGNGSKGSFTSAPDAAVMGRAAARELFGEGFDPVGEHITIGDRHFTVTGYFRTADPDMDETVFIPLAAGQAMLNGKYLQTITVSIEQAGDASASPSKSPRCCAIATAKAGRRRARGLGGNQLPTAGVGSADDFTVKTQAAAT